MNLMEDVNRADAADLYLKLREVIAPLFYDDRNGWVRVMRRSVALNASFYDADRMVRQYMANVCSRW